MSSIKVKQDGEWVKQYAGPPMGTVLYNTRQALTEAQQKQARDNIGADAYYDIDLTDIATVMDIANQRENIGIEVSDKINFTEFSNALKSGKNIRVHFNITFDNVDFWTSHTVLNHMHVFNDPGKGYDGYDKCIVTLLGWTNLEYGHIMGYVSMNFSYDITNPNNENSCRFNYYFSDSTPDTTLTKYSFPADAKAVGDALNEIDDRINGIMTKKFILNTIMDAEGYDMLITNQNVELTISDASMDYMVRKVLNYNFTGFWYRGGDYTDNSNYHFITEFIHTGRTYSPDTNIIEVNTMTMISRDIFYATFTIDINANKVTIYIIRPYQAI